MNNGFLILDFNELPKMDINQVKKLMSKQGNYFVSTPDTNKIKFIPDMEILYKIRLEIDGLIQISKHLPSSGQLWDELRLAKGWTTKAIKILSPEDDSSDIFPREYITELNDFSQIEFILNSPEDWSKKIEIERIDEILNMINKVISQLPDYDFWALNFQKEHYNPLIGEFPDESVIPNWRLEVDQVFIHLSQAKMFLGYRLLELRES